MRAKTYGERDTNELFAKKLLSYFLYYFNKIAANTQMFWYQSNGNCLNFMFLYVLHVENNFPVQDSGINLDKKIEKMTMCKAYLNLVMLANFVKTVPNNKVRTFIFKSMYGLLQVLVNFPLVIFRCNEPTQIGRCLLIVPYCIYVKLPV